MKHKYYRKRYTEDFAAADILNSGLRYAGKGAGFVKNHAQKLSRAALTAFRKVKHGDVSRNALNNINKNATLSPEEKRAQRSDIINKRRSMFEGSRENKDNVALMNTRRNINKMRANTANNADSIQKVEDMHQKLREEVRKRQLQERNANLNYRKDNFGFSEKEQEDDSELAEKYRRQQKIQKRNRKLGSALLGVSGASLGAASYLGRKSMGRGALKKISRDKNLTKEQKRKKRSEVVENRRKEYLQNSTARRTNDAAKRDNLRQFRKNPNSSKNRGRLIDAAVQHISNMGRNNISRNNIRKLMFNYSESSVKKNIRAEKRTVAAGKVMKKFRA